jgi:hypothetical protein
MIALHIFSIQHVDHIGYISEKNVRPCSNSTTYHHRPCVTCLSLLWYWTACGLLKNISITSAYDMAPKIVVGIHFAVGTIPRLVSHSRATIIPLSMEIESRLIDEHTVLTIIQLWSGIASTLQIFPLAIWAHAHYFLRPAIYVVFWALTCISEPSVSSADIDVGSAGKGFA